LLVKLFNLIINLNGGGTCHQISLPQVEAAKSVGGMRFFSKTFLQKTLLEDVH
jgi:hypothetical protein